jgi:hypothetical protein
MRRFGIVAAAAVVYGCVPPAQNAPAPLPKPQFTFVPSPPCASPGSARLTLAVVSPRWQDATSASGITLQARMAAEARAAAAPRAFAQMGAAMKADFLQLITCRGYLAKGPYDSFESMVYPDRQASQLLLEPELLISVEITSVEQQQPEFLQALVNAKAGTRISATATVGGRVNLHLKEPLTNTRMWTRSIEVPSQTFTFLTDQAYPPNSPGASLRYYAASDDGLIRALTPNLEAMYGKVFKTAEGYLNKEELQGVAVQAADVRKKAAIGVPPMHNH